MFHSLSNEAGTQEDSIRRSQLSNSFIQRYSPLVGRYRKRERVPAHAATIGRYPRTRSELGGAAPPSLQHHGRGE